MGASSSGRVPHPRFSCLFGSSSFFSPLSFFLFFLRHIVFPCLFLVCFILLPKTTTKHSKQRTLSLPKTGRLRRLRQGVLPFRHKPPRRPQGFGFGRWGRCGLRGGVGGEWNWWGESREAETRASGKMVRREKEQDPETKGVLQCISLRGMRSRGGSPISSQGKSDSVDELSLGAKVRYHTLGLSFLGKGGCTFSWGVPAPDSQ